MNKLEEYHRIIDVINSCNNYSQEPTIEIMIDNFFDKYNDMDLHKNLTKIKNDKFLN